MQNKTKQNKNTHTKKNTRTKNNKKKKNKQETVQTLTIYYTFYIRYVVDIKMMHCGNREGPKSGPKPSHNVINLALSFLIIPHFIYQQYILSCTVCSWHFYIKDITHQLKNAFIHYADFSYNWCIHVTEGERVNWKQGLIKVLILIYLSFDSSPCPQHSS